MPLWVHRVVQIVYVEDKKGATYHSLRSESYGEASAAIENHFHFLDPGSKTGFGPSHPRHLDSEPRRAGDLLPPASSGHNPRHFPTMTLCGCFHGTRCR